MSSWSFAKTCTLLATAILFCLTQKKASTEAANILGLFTSQSPSHLIVDISAALALAEKGHNVTVVCSVKPTITHRNINVILIPPSEEHTKAFENQVATLSSQKNNIFTTMRNFFGNFDIILKTQMSIIEDKRFTELYDNPDIKFDLMIYGFFMNDFQLGVAAKFKCPVIVVWTGPTNELVDVYVGNPRGVSYVPSMAVALKVGERMNFWQRIKNLFASTLLSGIRCLLDYWMDRSYKQLFPSDGKFPTFQDMKKNVSLVFINNHFSEGPIRPYVPAMVEIGGIQIKEKPNPLPKDIAEFLNSSEKNGAILFSLGSNLKGSLMDPETVKIFYKTFSSLKQNVIWKWEDLNKIPGKAKNILYQKWLPQDDILAHPNLKLFITHAGKGGLAESQYHGVPMVALPAFADQNKNADIMVNSGYGLQLDLLKLTVDDMTRAIHEVLSNKTYASNVREFSKLYRDRPLTAKETVVYWAEYVVRHHGAAHLQSPLVHLNELQANNLDILLLICVISFLLWKLAIVSLRYICTKLCKKSQTKKAKIQ